MQSNGQMSAAQARAEERLRQELEPLPPPQPGRRYTVRAAMRYLAKSRMTLYLDVKAGRVRVIRDGRRVFFPGDELLRLTSLDPTESATPEPEADRGHG